MTLTKIRQLVDAHPAGRGMATGVPRQSVTREDTSARDVDLAYRPMICFVVGGAKTTTAGHLATRVAAGQLFVSQLNLPVRAAYEPPYRSVTLDIDENLLAAVLAESAGPTEPIADPPSGSSGAIVVADMDEGVVSAVTRWVALAEEPHLLPSLAPGTEREVLVRILHGPLGPALRQTGTSGSMAAIRELAAHLTRHFDQPVAAADLARRAGMSSATLYRQFRAATGMSPGQFHKMTRLQAARRLLVNGTHTSAGAAVAVGYRSVPQFSRDYRRQYGVTPTQDLRNLRGAALPR